MPSCVCFTPEGGHVQCTRPCQLRAKSGLWSARPFYRCYWCLQRARAKAPQKNIAPSATANQAGGPWSGGLLKMVIAPTQSATPMPRQVNRRMYFHTVIAASKDPSRDQRPAKSVSCDKHAPTRHAPLADRTAVTPRVSLSPANVRGPFSPLWPPPPCFRKRQASFLAAPTDRHDRSPTSMP